MNGKGLYYAIAALLGVMSVLHHFYLFLSVFLLYLSILYYYKAFTFQRTIIVFLVFCLYCFAGERVVSTNKTLLKKDQVEFQVIIKDWKIDGDKIQIIAEDRDKQEKLMIQYRMKSQQEKMLLSHQFLYDTTCKLSGKLDTPSSARNPQTFDYRNYLSTKEIHWILTVEQFPLRQCSPSKKTFLSLLHFIRFKGTSYIIEQFPDPSAALAIALVFGDREWMEADLVTSYQRTGLVHLLAISGLHVSFLTGLIFYFGIRIGVVRETMLTGLILLLPLYALLTGATPSVLRAVIMTFLVLLSIKIASKRFLPIDAWSYALLIMLLYSPFIILDIGFQLSFAVSFALLFSSSLILKYEHPFLQLLFTSFVAQIASLPVLLWNFYEFSLISLPANILFVPFFSILLPIIFFLFFFLPLMGGFLQPPMLILNLSIVIANRIVEWLSQIPFTMLTLGRPDWRFLLFYIVLFLIFFINWEKRWRVQLLFVLLTPFLLHMAANFWSPNGEITFIDVGQGDAILIKLPYHKGVYLIDTGGKVPFAKEQWQERGKEFEVGRDIVIPVLKSKGITTIDKLILTHGDYDHIGGAKSILGQLKVKEMLIPRMNKMSEIEKETIQLAMKKKVIINYLEEGDRWVSGKSIFQVLSPAADVIKEDRNNMSIAIVANIGGLTWMFAGDLEAEGEKEIARKYHTMDIDVLKAAHHGSKTSTTEELLTAFSPEIAVISAGEQNRYGHPHQEVISRLRNRRIAIFRTDQSGAITYFFKGKRGTFSTVLP